VGNFVIKLVDNFFWRVIQSLVTGYQQQ